MSPWTIMMGLVLLLTPVICWVFTLHAPETRTKLNRIGQLIHEQRYYLHAIGYLVIIKWKGFTDDLNEPIKVVTGHWTGFVHGIEGNTVLWIQDAFASPTLTAVLNFHYLFIYLFLIYVTTVFYETAARAVGVELSAYELEFTKKVLSVDVASSDADGARTEAADAIEAEDLALEEARRRREARKGCGCAVA